MGNTSLLRKSGQWWKLQISIIVIVIGFALMFGGLIHIHKSNISFLYTLFGILLGLGAFVFACVAIRCPSCGAYWFWDTVSKEKAGEWILLLLKADKCNVCGNTYNKK